jgi:vitamin B12/bleomycin/antimicrobial peptide transport system ATP-binding/permease protein
VTPFAIPATRAGALRGGAPTQIRELLHPLLRSKARIRICWLAGGIVAVLVANAVGQIRLNEWQGQFYDALEARDLAVFFDQTLIFLAIVGVLLALVVSQTWLAEMLKIKLRDWLTSDMVERWMAPSHAYRLASAGEIGINPDQRLHEDVRKLTELTTELGIGLLQALMLLVSFVGVLWILSAEVVFHLGGKSFTVPGYMVWCALAYSVGGSILAWIVGRPLVRLSDELYGREAELRFEMVRIAEAAEGIAVYRGEADERRRLQGMIVAVVGVMSRRASGLAQLTWITSGYGWLAIIAPVLVAAPGYFSGDLSFGKLMMVVGAFSQVQMALRWFVDNVARIADWRATLLRVATLREALAAIDRTGVNDGPRPRIALTKSEQPYLELRDLSVALPDGSARLAQGSLKIGRGERLLIVGGASAGKSTLFRAIAGLWPWGEGEIRLPSGDMLFLPNRPYLPPGTLRESVSYPASVASVQEDLAASALEMVGLGHLVSQLDRPARWDRELALDEQQRLAFARALLHRPAWLVMDDAASAIALADRRALYRLLHRDQPGMAIIAFERDPKGYDDFFRAVPLVREATQPVVEHVVAVTA